VEWAEQQLPTFTKASQNVATTATLLDTLATPSTNGVVEVYQRLKSILGTAAVQQAESSLQQRATQGTLDVGTATSPIGFSAYDHLSRPGARSEP
jgi:hypothetical protein